MANDLQVLSVYEGFFSGGARILHSDVLCGLHGGRHGQRHSVLSIHGEMHREATRQPMHEDPCYRRLVADGVSVATLGRSSGAPDAFDEAELETVARLARGADVILTLKEQPLRLVGQAGVRDRPVIACLHRSDPENQGPAFAALRDAALSGRLAAAVCCAESAKHAYMRAGIPGALLHVIPNGVDLRRFRPDRRARAAVRAEAGIPADAPVVVLAARYDEMKNVPLFLAAAAVLLAARPDAHILMCGTGMTRANPGLLRDLAAAGLEAEANPPGAGRVHLLGPRPDPEAIFAAADVVALTSAFGEAAPLCLIEGMLCGAVPVATDVGDCAAIVAGHGLITAPRPDAVADAWSEALARRAEFHQASLRTRHRFSRTRMIAEYGSLIRSTHRSARRTVAAAAAVSGGAVSIGTAPAPAQLIAR
ncbi:MAG TPA: glycosyltransferase [Actinocrinis sp.]